jgi:preprotein translocase subunit YajC
VSPAPLVALLQAGPAPAFWQSPIIPFAVMLLLIWLLIIRPQQRKQKQHDEMLKAIAKGDQVVTAGGLHGRVVGTSDDTLTLEIAALKGERVRVKVSRNRIESRQPGKGEDAE